MKIVKKIILAIYRRGRAYERNAYLEKLKKRGLKVGKNLKMLSDVIIDESHCWLISIGDDVTLAPRVHILAHDASTKVHLGYTRIGKVTIGHRVFIGASAIILPGIDIGDDAIVAAGSVVTSDVPAKTVVAGNPAKAISTLEDFLLKRKEEMQRYPLFDERFTILGGVNKAMKEEMNKQMKERCGYII